VVGPTGSRGDLEGLPGRLSLVGAVLAVTVGYAFLVLRRSANNGRRVKVKWWTVVGVGVSPVAIYAMNLALLLLHMAVL